MHTFQVSKLNPGECFKVDYLTWTSIKGLIKSCSTYPGAVSSEPAGANIGTLVFIKSIAGLTIYVNMNSPKHHTDENNENFVLVYMIHFDDY